MDNIKKGMDNIRKGIEDKNKKYFLDIIKKLKSKIRDLSDDEIDQVEMINTFDDLINFVMTNGTFHETIPQVQEEINRIKNDFIEGKKIIPDMKGEIEELEQELKEVENKVNGIQTWQQYLEFTRTTAVYPKENELGYLMFGVTDEIGEFKREIKSSFTSVERRVDELSDVCWYLARLTDNLEMYELDRSGRFDNTDGEVNFINKVPDIDGTSDDFILDAIDHLQDEYNRMAGCLKKFIRDENDSKMDKAKEHLLVMIAIVQDLSTMIGGYNLQNILKVNVEKLTDRKDRGVLKGDGDNR